jgi:hypothetical protein
MLERFTESMRAELEKPAAAAPARAPASVPTTPPPPAAAPSPAPAAASPPLEVSSVVFRQPAFWLAALALVAALIWFLSR